MKHLFLFLFLLISASGFAQIDAGELTATDTTYVVVETADISGTDYFRLAIVEVANGYKNIERTAPQEAAAFQITLAAYKERLAATIATLEADEVKLATRIALLEAMEAEIDGAITP